MWTPSRLEGLEGTGARRVLMVLESVFPSPGAGGAEGQVLTLGRHLRDRGIDVLVIAPLVAKGPQARQDTVEGLKVIRIPYPRIAKVGGVILAARLSWLLLAHRHAYVAIHAHIANTMAAVCCLVGPVAGRPVIVKLTGALELNRGILAAQRRDLYIRCLRWALRRATYYQAISGRIAGLLPQLGFDATRVRQIPNAVDTRLYGPPSKRVESRRELRIEAKLVGLFSGRLVREKGLAFFFNGWARVFDQHETAILLVAGGGELLEELTVLARDLGISHQVQFLGSRASIGLYLEAADFAVLPSSSEGLSNSLLEYMAAGLPVVGSRVSGTEDFVRHGENGWLFESENLGQLEACLREVGATSRERLHAMGARGRRDVEERAALPVVVESLARLYNLEPEPAAAARG